MTKIGTAKSAVGHQRARGSVRSFSLSGLLLYSVAWLLAPAALPAQVLTQVSDTLYNADGSTASGRMAISWEPFTTADSSTIDGGTLFYTIPASGIDAGEVEVSLAPNAGATPAGTSYRVRYYLANGASYTETWVVPAAGPVTIAEVRVLAAPVPGVVIPPQYVQGGTANRCARFDAGGALSSHTADCGAGGGGGHTIEEEGTPLASRTGLNFVGPAITATDDAGNDETDVAVVIDDSTVPNNITLDNITQVTARGIGDTSGDLAASRVDDGGVASTQALFSGAGAAAGFRAIADGDIPATIARDSELHSQSHLIADTTGLGPDHTTTGLTAGQVLRATGTTTAAFAALQDGDIPAAITRDSEVNVQGTANEITSSGAGVAPTLSLAASLDLGGKSLEVPNSITLPGTCTVGQVYHDTNAAAGSRWSICSALNTWTAIDNPFGAAVDDSELASNYSGVGSCTNQAVTAVNDNAAPTCITITSAYTSGTFSPSAHVSSHQEDGADELLGETMGTACSENQILKANASGGLDCAADATGGSPTFDQIGSGTNTTAAMVVGSGASLRSAAGILGVPNSVTVPSTCTVGDIYHDNNAAAGSLYHLCTATDTFTPIDNPFGTAINNAEVDDDITLTSITQITNRAIGDTSGDLAASRVDDGGVASTQALFSGAGAAAGFRAIADGDIPAAITRDSEWPSATATFTNKTLNAESSGNLLTTVERIALVAAGCNNTTAAPGWDVPTSNGPTASCYGTAPQRFGGLDFPDGASALTSTTHLRLPSDWTGNVDATLLWFSASTSTNSAVWTLATSCAADSEGLFSPTFNTTQTVSDANNASANTRNSASIASITTTGCAAGETLFLRIGRDPTNGSDTLAATAALLEFEITLRRAQ